MCKKSLLMFILSITILILPVYSQTKFGILVLGSYAYIANTDFNDAIEGEVNWQQDYYSEQEKFIQTFLPGYELNGTVSGDQIHGTLGADIEFQIKPSPEFMVGIGIGYIGFPTSTYKEKMSDNFNNSAEYEAEFYGNAIPLTLTGYYILPINDNINFALGAGAEYYIGNFTRKEVKNVVNGTNQELDPPYEYSATGFGACLKLGGEYKLSDNISILAGIIGRFGKIGGLEGDIKQDDGSTKKEKMYSLDMKDMGKTYHLWKSLTDSEKSSYESDPDVSNLQEAEIILTGVKVYLGIGFTF